jgi:homoserine dehydrogenase
MKIILVGFGTVGQGLAELLLDKGKMLQSRYGFEPVISGVATRSKGILYRYQGLSIPDLLEAAKKGSFEYYPDGEGLERDFSDAVDLLQRRGSDVMVEVTPTDLATAMPASAHFQAAIVTKKHIVTANKGPIAIGYQQLKQRAKEAGVQIRFEATVMSGTPAIATGLELLAGSGIQEVRGILNGTTNYMLTQMERGLDYEAALKQAQALGYAETDPTADVEGYDAAAKVLILMAAIFGQERTLKDLDFTGITQITSADMQEAKAAHERYKLIASANLSGGSVKPIRLPINDPLAQIDGVSNAITFLTDTLGAVTLIGAGAGQRETAFGLLSDLLALHRMI